MKIDCQTQLNWRSTKKAQPQEVVCINIFRLPSPLTFRICNGFYTAFLDLIFEAKFSVEPRDFIVTNQRRIQKQASIPGKRANLLNIPLTMKSLRDYSEARGKERCWRRIWILSVQISDFCHRRSENSSWKGARYMAICHQNCFVCLLDMGLNPYSFIPMALQRLVEKP